MRHIPGIYNGTTVEFPEPPNLVPGTMVEVVVPEEATNAIEPLDADAIDRAIMETLYGRGLVANIEPPTAGIDFDWQPVPNPGDPIADDILAERR